jgi:iron(III) transport system substrate-binding protein
MDCRGACDFVIARQGFSQEAVMKNFTRVYRSWLFLTLLSLWQLSSNTTLLRAGEAKTPALEKLIKAAKAEGGTFIADAVIDDARGRKEVEAAMEKMFGFKVKWESVDLMNQNRFASRLLKELEAGRQPSTDVFNGTQSTVPRLMEGNALEKIDNWRELLPRIPREAIVPGGGALAERTRIGGFAYNTKLVPANKVPKKMDDFLDPFWKGKLASTTYGAVWDRAGARQDGTFDTEKAKRIADLLSKLVKENHIVGLLRCGDENRIASGEFAGLALLCSGDTVDLAQRKGAPLDMAYLDETSNLTHSYVALMKNAKYPNMAKLFMVFLNTAEGQALLRKWEATDTSFYPENYMFKIVQDLKKRNINPPYIDIPTYLKVQDEVEKWKDVYQKILIGQK